MDERSFFIINIALSIIALLINLLAAFILWKRRQLKPFQIILLNIVVCNAVYALNEMSTAVIFFTYPNLLQDNEFFAFRNLKAELIAHLICFFIVLMTFQRFIAVMVPLKYATYATATKSRLAALIIYCTIVVLFIVCSVLIWETSIDASIIDKTLSSLFIIEGVFLIMCYITIICRARFYQLKRSSVFSNQNKRIFKVALIVSMSFLISYTPIAFVLVLNVKSQTTFQIVLLMVWTDSFINPLAIIFNIEPILGSKKRTIRKALSKRKHQSKEIGGEESTSHSYTNGQ